MNDAAVKYPTRQVLLVGLVGTVLFIWAWLIGDDLYLARGWFWEQWFKGLPGWLSWAWRQTHYVFYIAFLLIAVRALRAGDRRTFLACVVYLAAQLLIAFLLVRLLKLTIGRPRPHLEYQGPAEWRPWAWSSQYESIPSGHSADAAVGVGITTWFFDSMAWRIITVLLLLAIMVGRLVQSQHYPSDVIAGALIGYLGSLTLAWAVSRFMLGKK